MSPAIIFLEPKGTAFAVVKSAIKKGYKILIIAQDVKFVLKSAKLYQCDLTDNSKIILVNDWNNLKKLERTVKKLEGNYEIEGIYANGEQCVEACAFLRLKYHLSSAPHENINTVLNKYKLRRTLIENNLSLLRNYHSKEVDTWSNWEFDGPAYFKPVKGTGSLFIEKCYNLEDLRRARKNWKDSNSDLPTLYLNYLHSSDEYHLEEEIEGKLYSVEGISVNGEYHFLGIVSTIVFSENPIIEMGSCFPYEHPMKEKMVGLVKDAHRVLGITDGPTHTEVIVNNSTVEIIDLNPRFIGADVMYSINYALDINIEEILLDWIVGKPILGFNTIPVQYSCLQYIMPPLELETFHSIDFPDESDIVFTLELAEKNSKISKNPSQIDVIGVYLTVGESFKEAIEKSNYFQSKIQVNGKYLGRY